MDSFNIFTDHTIYNLYVVSGWSANDPTPTDYPIDFGTPAELQKIYEVLDDLRQRGILIGKLELRLRKDEEA